MLIQFIFFVNCLELALSSRLTPLTIDEHPCKPEKIRHQNRYICDSKGNVECLAGWTNQNYSAPKQFPCSVPICDPPCLNGVCKAPDVCSCDIGWEGLDCGTCLKLPGCVNGGCIDPKTNITEPLKCFCKNGWKGALCDQASCEDFNDCNNRGKCVFAGGVHQCICDLGWKGRNCTDCTAYAGCDTSHTITIEGCQKVDPGSADPNSPDLIDTGNSCQCAEKWKGPFCGQPKCLMRKDNTTEIQCVHGTCTATETDTGNGTLTFTYCKCDIGWWGEKCDRCLAHPGCPNKRRRNPAQCVLPYECRCRTLDDTILSDVTALGKHKFCTDFIPQGGCKADADCRRSRICSTSDGTVGTCRRNRGHNWPEDQENRIDTDIDSEYDDFSDLSEYF